MLNQKKKILLNQTINQLNQNKRQKKMPSGKLKFYEDGSKHPHLTALHEKKNEVVEVVKKSIKMTRESKEKVAQDGKTNPME